MPPSQYLQSGEYATYGLPASTTVQQVNQASVLIDAHLKRPEGLVYSPDSQGNPAYMTAADPHLSFTLGAGGLAPGQNVVANVGGALNALNVGEVLVIDQATSNLVEDLTVVAVNVKTGQVTFANVLNNHAQNATMTSGQVITEQRYMPKNRPIIMAGRTPLLRIISGIGRYAYPRRGDQFGSNTDDFNLLATFTQFGGPPQWEIFDTTTQTGIDPRTGQIWVPAGIMLAYYTEVKIRYVAGYPSSAIPTAVKLACAKLVKAVANDPGLGAARSFRAGDTQIDRFAATVFDDDTANMLRPYRINGVV